MRLLFSTLLAFALSCAVAVGAALVPVPTLQPSLPAAGLEQNLGQADTGILFLCPGNPSIAVTAQSVLYSPPGATLSLAASNPNPTVSYSDPLPGLANSYTGAASEKWITGIPRYGAISLAAVYPGVNALYTIATNGALTLNLLLNAGVNPNIVTFAITQASSITLNPDGSLLVKIGSTPSPEAPPPSLTYPVPIASQGAASRSVSFVVQSTTQFGFAVQGLDSTQPLQISIQLNGASPEAVIAFRPEFLGPNLLQATDAAGNTYFATTIADAAGKTAPFSFASGCGIAITIPLACSDVAIYKYSAAGVLDFVTYLAGRTNEVAGFVGLSSSGAVVVAGTTDSTDFPVSAGVLQPTYAGPAAQFGEGGGPVSGNFFATQLDSSTGALISSTFLGGPEADTMSGAALGTDGSLYFLPGAASQSSAEMPVTSAALQPSCTGNPCASGYAARLSPAFDKLIYGTYLPGNSIAAAQLYSDGSVYYAGDAEAGFPVTPGAYQEQNAGGYDGIVARLDPTGSTLMFATYYGGPNTDSIDEIAVAPDGSVWAAVGSYVECCVNVQNQLIHLDANGARLLAEQPIAVDYMTVDTLGNLFALASGNVTVSPDAFLADSCGSDAYVQLNASGQELFATYLPDNILRFNGADGQGTPFLETTSGSLLQVVQNQSMGPYAGCVVDSASFGNEEATSAGAIVTIFGSGLGPSQGVGFQLQNGQVPTSLGGTQVLVNTEPAPILYSSYWQLNVILPYSLTVGSTASVQVVSAGTPANQLSDSVIEQGISFFSVGNGAAAALNQDGTLNSPQNPAQPGSTVMLFGTGGGQTVPASVAGEITPLAIIPLMTMPQVKIVYGPFVLVEWAGAAPGLVAGATQVNVTLPDVIPVVPGYPSGTLPLQVIDNGFNSGIVTISVAPN